MPTKKDMTLEMLENWRPWKEITNKLGYGGARAGTNTASKERDGIHSARQEKVKKDYSSIK